MEFMFFLTLIVFLILTFFLRKKSVNKDLKYIYGDLFYSGLPDYFRSRFISVSEEKHLKELSSPFDYEREREKYAKEKLGVLTLILILGFIVSLLFGADYIAGARIDNALSKPAYKEGDRKEKLKYKINYDGGKEGGFLDVELEEMMSDEEVLEFLELRYEELLGIILGEDNTGFVISENLNLINKPFGDNDVIVKYSSRNEEIINDAGEISKDNTKVGEDYPVSFDISLEYRGVTFPVNVDFVIRRNAISLAEEEAVLKERISEVGAEVLLPGKLLERDGEITWYKTSVGVAWYQIFATFLIISIAVFYLYKRVLETRLERREHSILLDLPDVINKLTLLIKAGFTAKKAWLIICDDYERNRTVARPLFEEMLVARNELLKGVSFEEMLLGFGAASGNHQLMSMVSVLSQNIKRGSTMLIMALEQMGKEAWDMRMYQAKLVGEKASTKLLIPLGISFLVVIVVIMAPLMMSMNV